MTASRQDTTECELCGDQGPLLLRARCHLTAPLRVTLEEDQLLLHCYLPSCGREVARFSVVRPSDGPNGVPLTGPVTVGGSVLP